jgi:outer membrane lipopolysaccharide assembly protein LptE/RlpB
MRREYDDGQADWENPVSPESRVPGRKEAASREPRVATESTLRSGFFSGLRAQDSGLRGGFLPVLGTRYSVLTWYLVLFLLLSTACGYHTAGHVVQVPENIQTIAVPAFANASTSYRIEQMLTASVVHEFTTRTRYRILHQASDDADATLMGTVLSTSATPLTYDTTTGRAASVLVVVSISVTFTDRHGKVLYQNPAYVFREQYELSQDLATFFQEDSPALQRLSRDFGRTLISNLLEGY